VGTYPRLFSLLLDQGDWTEEQLAKLAGKNMLRVLKQVDEVNILSNKNHHFLQQQKIKISGSADAKTVRYSTWGRICSS